MDTWARKSFDLGGEGWGILCAAGGLAASLPFAHWKPVASPRTTVTTKNASQYCQCHLGVKVAPG